MAAVVAMVGDRAWVVDDGSTHWSLERLVADLCEERGGVRTLISQLHLRGEQLFNSGGRAATPPELSVRCWTELDRAGVSRGTAGDLGELALLKDVLLEVVRLHQPKPAFWRDCDATDLGGQWAVFEACEDFQLVITDLSGRIEVLDGGTHLGWTRYYMARDVDGRRAVIVPRIGTSIAVGPSSGGPVGTFVVRAMRTTLVDHQRNIVEALRRLFTASVETGNPVCWT